MASTQSSRFIVGLGLTLALMGVARGEDKAIRGPIGNAGSIRIKILAVPSDREMREGVPHGICLSTGRIFQADTIDPQVFNSPEERTTFADTIHREALVAYQRLSGVNKTIEIMPQPGRQRLTILAYVRGWDVDSVFTREPEIVAFQVRQGEIGIDCIGSQVRLSRERFGDRDYLILCEIDANVQRAKGDDGRVKVSLTFRPDTLSHSTRYFDLPSREVTGDFIIAEREK